MNHFVNILISKNNNLRIEINPETRIKDLHSQISKKISGSNKFYYLTYCGKILPPNSNLLLQKYNIYNESSIQLNFRNKGGIGFLIDMFVAIGSVFEMIGKGIIVLGKVVIWFAMFVWWFMQEFLNPVKLITEFFTSILNLTKFIVYGIVDIFMGLVKNIFNYVFDNTFTSIWGWDQNIDENKDRTGTKDNFGNLGKKSKQCGRDQKCYQIPNNKVPFSIIASTILLPPLGLLMEFGISSWINILICAVLTLVYYFPGLIYALVLIYC